MVYYENTISKKVVKNDKIDTIYIFIGLLDPFLIYYILSYSYHRGQDGNLGPCKVIFVKGKNVISLPLENGMNGYESWTRFS